MIRTLFVPVLLCCALGCGKDKPTNQEPQKPAEPQNAAATPAKPETVDAPKKEKEADGPFKLTAHELEAELKKDRKATNAKYKDKVIELSGTIRSTAPNEYAPVSTIDFAPAERLGTGVLCSTKSVIAPGTLAIGQTIRVRGTWSDLGPVLIDCAVIEQGPDTAIRTTAEQVAKDTTADPIKAAEKYERRTLVLTGEVATIKNTEVPGVKFLELKGDGKTVVECRFGLSSESGKIPDRYKVGDKAVFACELARTDKGLFVVAPCFPVTEKK